MFVKPSVALASMAALASTVMAYGDSYTLYQGDGGPENGWPDWTRWESFDDLWNANYYSMQNSCQWNNYGNNNSPDEINNIRNSILRVADETGVDSRLIFTVMMQESKGCVRVKTSYNGVTNPGLMQSHNGPGTCEGWNYCPEDRILQMIRDGTAGTADGRGLRGTLDQAIGTVGNSPRAFYAAARIYNSGSINWGDLDDGLGSTRCYATDIANRLQGWTFAQSKC